jgi:hypothetical protein
MIVKGQRQPAAYAPTWYGRDEAGQRVAPGIHFVRLRADDFKATQKLVKLK